MLRHKHFFLDWSLWGFGPYINFRSYKYVAFMLGPLWIYIWAQKGLLEKKEI